ncbi:hypothetical protein [Chroococcidiopsis sp. SAG 2025]|uniref:hypothetical protein n=1 Tax=Chroococcidiopsis sp. SAG 2025 TaxID=171389 RepID=UPI0029371FDE|nr:hypothetical protein [Chroococcidiopsis sp. SAG 2025]
MHLKIWLQKCQVSRCHFSHCCFGDGLGKGKRDRKSCPIYHLIVLFCSMRSQFGIGQTVFAIAINPLCHTPQQGQATEISLITSAG